MSRIHDALKKAGAEPPATGNYPAESLLHEAGQNPPGGHEPRDAELAGLPPVHHPGGDAFRRTDRMWQTFAEHCPRCEWAPDPGTILFYGEEFRTPGSEEFRTLRSRLDLVRERQPLQTLLVTSPMAGDGKTFVAANLAQVIVWQRERHVLLIDADLRSPRLHRALGVPSAPGLSDYLAGKVDEFAVVKRGPLENFFFIPSGTAASNASELIASGKFRTLLKRLAVAFDWIIIDSPPVIPISDARLTAEYCDGVLLVLRSGETAGDLAQVAHREFRGKSFVGVILNQVDPHSTYGYGYSYEKGPGAQKTGGNRK
ncbi:MAG: tyrosine-protein kinase family protein [Terriglobia bacterium]